MHRGLYSIPFSVSKDLLSPFRERLEMPLDLGLNLLLLGMVVWVAGKGKDIGETKTKNSRSR